MTDQNPMAVLVRGKLDSMKELAVLLKKRGIPSEIRKPDPKTCGSSWGTTLELAVASTDLADGAELLKERWNSGLSDAEIAQTDMVVDFDAEQTTCPACMTSFKPDALLCPGCGLRFGWSLGRLVDCEPGILPLSSWRQSARVRRSRTIGAVGEWTHE